MLNLDPTLLLLLVACLFILAFGALGFARREGLSIQFALEVVALTALLIGGSWLLGIQINPFLFLVLLYLVTMRSRLIVDVANLLVGRRKYDLAFRLYRLALAWWPDASSRLIVLTNQGAAELRSGQIDAAIETLDGVLEIETKGRLGLKCEAASLYNLGHAYEKKGELAKAISHYNQAIDLLPGTLYGQAAQSALKRIRQQQPDDSRTSDE